MNTDRSRMVEVKDSQGRRYTYLLQKELGSGNCTVYLARVLDHSLGMASQPAMAGNEASENEEEPSASMRWVAVKVAHGPKWKGYLHTEAQLLKRLQANGSGPKRVVGIGAGGEVLENEVTRETLIELEHLDGQTLEQWFQETWQKKPAVTPQAAIVQLCDVLIPLTEALQELAELPPDPDEPGSMMGVLHRDIKPANIMLTQDGLRLFDFNAARLAGDEELTQNVGTAGYQAPEVVSSAHYDQRVDLFSLGVIGWEILHQKRFPHRNTFLMTPTYQIPWPSERYKGLSPSIQKPLTALMQGLLVDAPRRLSGPEPVQRLLRELSAAVRQPSRQEGLDFTSDLDLIQLLSELRQGGLNSVVVDAELNDALQRFVREQTRVEEPLEGYLGEELKRSLRQESGGFRLLVLSGNAGDGKSYLIRSLLERIKKQPIAVRERLHTIADATHATRPDEDQSSRLQAFFKPFAEGAAPSDRVHLIAMNTGMVIRFFEDAQARAKQDPSLPRFDRLFETLQVQLGLKRAAPGMKPVPGVRVVNLDLRSMVARGEAKSFLERMLDRLSPTNPDGLVAGKLGACGRCPARTLCPVHFNLEALSQPLPRRALLASLQRAALDPEVHLSPRNLWGFLYRLVTGGARYHEEAESERRPCDEVRRRVARGTTGDKTWLLNGHFYQVLFASEGKGLESALRQLDPAFVSSQALDLLHTRLGVQPDLDQQGAFIAELGGQEDSLHGLSLKKLLNEAGQELEGKALAWRRDSAIRRHVLFNPQSQDAYLKQGEFDGFELVLDAYQKYSLEGPQTLNRLTQQERDALRNLVELVREVVVKGYGFRFGKQIFLGVSPPNPHSKSRLLVEVDESGLKDIFGLKQVLRPDIHVEAHRENPELLSQLGYRPRMITLSLRSHRLMVDRDLFSFLLLVKRGQQPSAQDLAQFQTIRFAGEKLGNQLAARKDQPLYVLQRSDSDGRRLFKLWRDDFEELRMEEVVSSGSN